MKHNDSPDPNIEFKKHFVQIVENYLADPTDKKQAKLATIVSQSIELDPDLLLWFNAMFKWRNVKPLGLHVQFRHNPKVPF